MWSLGSLRSAVALLLRNCPNPYPGRITASLFMERCVNFNPMVYRRPHTTYRRLDKCDEPYNGSGACVKLGQNEDLEQQHHTGRRDKGV
jgi:hypothetical protein